MNKKIAIVLALAVVGVFAAVIAFNGELTKTQFYIACTRGYYERNLTRVFNEWKVQHNKTYGYTENTQRLKIFEENLKNINKMNYVKRNYTVGLNKFSDLSKAEFASIYLGLKARKEVAHVPVTESVVSVQGGSVDWRQKNAVTDVKNQGQCGSCWAFSTTGSLEGLNAITNGNLLSFSEQQLVDCAGGYGNEGCNGGMMEWALQYTAATGITLEDSYPYTAQDGDCQTGAIKAAFQNKNYQAANSQDALFTAVTQQPVSISVEADQDCFQAYTGGVLDDVSCGTNLDHGVLAVGYGTDSNGIDYWIVKNSWGADWGDNGFIKIARTSGDGVCGINMDNAYPTL